MLGQLVTKVFTGEAGVFFARMRRVALIAAIAAIFALATLGFLIGAIYVWVADAYGSFAASLIFAGLSFVLLAISIVAMIIAKRPPKQRASDRLQRDIASIASVAALSNAPALFRSVRRRRSLLLIPVGGGILFAVLRAINAWRYRR